MSIKGDHQVVIVITIFLAGFFISNVVSEIKIDIPHEILIMAIATLFAAFLGSWYSFKLHDQKQERTETERQRGAINQTIFELYQMWNSYTEFNKNILEPLKGKPEPWLNMKFTTDDYFERINFPKEELFFLLNSKHAELFSKLILEVNRYNNVVSMLNERNRMVKEVLMPKMEENGYFVGGSIIVEDVIDNIGKNFCEQLKILTDGIIKQVYENLASSKALYNELRTTMKEHFDEEPLIEIVFDQ